MALTWPQAARVAVAMTIKPAAAATMDTDIFRLGAVFCRSGRGNVYAVLIPVWTVRRARRFRRLPLGQTPAACMPRSSCFSSLTSSLNRAASSN